MALFFECFEANEFGQNQENNLANEVGVEDQYLTEDPAILDCMRNHFTLNMTRSILFVVRLESNLSEDRAINIGENHHELKHHQETSIILTI